MLKIVFGEHPRVFRDGTQIPEVVSITLWPLDRATVVSFELPRRLSGAGEIQTVSVDDTYSVEVEEPA